MKLILTLLFAVLMSFITHADDSEKKILKKARKELTKGDYIKAKSYYKQLLDASPNNPEYHFETGLAFYNSNVEKEKSLGYFENALAKSENDTIGEVLYYLGRSNQYMGNFEEAKTYYNQFKTFVTNNNDGVVLNRDVDRFIEMCNNGIHYAGEINKNITLVNIGGGVNTEGAEYAPVVKDDKSLLIYTGRKQASTGDKFYHDNQEYEDIFVSRYEGDVWGSSNRFDSSNVYISKDINSKYHDAAVSYNEDETKLYIYRKNHVWVSEKNNGKWDAPIKMNKNVNSRGHEPSVFITKDEKTLYVVSTDRKDGVGGRDIWVSQKDGEEWGELSLLKGNINTPYDEDAPFLSDDGKTMYFSSNGHSTMGGYDVFKTELQSDNTWSDPVNLGAPINTPGDDIYYVFGSDSTEAYYSSSQSGGYGNMDIYFIQLECRNIPTTEIKGMLLAGNQQFPVGAELIVFDSNNNEVTRVNSDPKTGRYMLVLQPQKDYTLEVNAADPWYLERNHKESFTLPKQCDPFPLYQEISLNRLKDEDGVEYAQEALFQNAFFNVEDSLRKQYNIPGTVSGYTDMPEDSSQLNIAGNIKFNDVLNVNEDAKVYLINSRNEIVRIAHTNKEGDFVFRNLNSEERYMVAMDQEDLKYMYYGDNSNNGLIVKGHVENSYPNNSKASEDIADMNIYFFNSDKRVTNLTSSDSLGNFILDNLPDAPIDVNNTFAYSIDNNELEYAASALIHSIDPKNNTISYTEVVDLIYIDTTSTGGPGGPLGPDGNLANKFENIYFDFDKYFLRNKSKQILDDIYNFMASNETVRIKMDGHTDWYGTNAYNDALSKKRSVAAYNYLVSKGIDKSRISTKWFGETQPSVPNANPDGSDNAANRQLNRRVQFKLNTANVAYTFSM